LTKDAKEKTLPGLSPIWQTGKRLRRGAKKIKKSGGRGGQGGRHEEEGGIPAGKRRDENGA